MRRSERAIRLSRDSVGPPRRDERDGHDGLLMTLRPGCVLHAGASPFPCERSLGRRTMPAKRMKPRASVLALARSSSSHANLERETPALRADLSSQSARSASRQAVILRLMSSSVVPSPRACKRAGAGRARAASSGGHGRARPASELPCSFPSGNWGVPAARGGLPEAASQVRWRLRATRCAGAAPCLRRNAIWPTRGAHRGGPSFRMLTCSSRMVGSILAVLSPHAWRLPLFPPDVELTSWARERDRPSSEVALVRPRASLRASPPLKRCARRSFARVAAVNAGVLECPGSTSTRSGRGRPTARRR